MSDHTEFRAVSSFNQPLIIATLEQNLKDWISWSMLRIGGWVNVTTGNSSVRGLNAATLQKVNDPSYINKTVFQSPRKDWVYETSGVNYVSPTGGNFNPLPVKVYSNNIEVSTGLYYINYPEGRVIFNSPQNGTISAQYSYRSVQVYTENETNWTMEVNQDTQKLSEQWNLNVGSGDFALSSTNRLQLPAIVIEPVSEGSSAPYELGTLAARNKQDILLHILTEDKTTRNNLCDIFRFQRGKSIHLYDLYKVYAGGYYPLDERGMKVNNPPLYPDLVNNTDLMFRQAFFDNIKITNINTKNPNLHWSVVRLTLEVIY